MTEAASGTKASIGRVLTNALFTALAIGLTAIGFYTHGQGLLKGELVSVAVFIFYAFMLTLFLIRRDAKAESPRLAHRVIAFCTSFLSFLLQPIHGHPFHGVILVGMALWVIGAVGSIAAIACLGRGFGIIAACREVKTHGLYRWMRHPLYAFELIWFLSLILIQLSWFNIALFSLLLICQIMRLLEEERVLCEFSAEYRQYYQQVRFRLIPGIY